MLRLRVWVNIPNGRETICHPSPKVEVCSWGLIFLECPLERADPPAAFVLRDGEYAEIWCPPLEELAAQLLASLANHLLVSQRHRLMKGPLEGLSARRGEVCESTHLQEQISPTRRAWRPWTSIPFRGMGGLRGE